LLGILSKSMSQTQNNLTIKDKILDLCSPRFTMFVVPFIVISIMFMMNFTDGEWDFAQYQHIVLIFSLTSFSSLISLYKYKPEQKLEKYGPHKFIGNHLVMRYTLLGTVILLIFFVILFEFEEELKITGEWSNFLLYVVVYLLMMALLANRLFNYSITLDSAFIFSKAYCTKFTSATKKTSKISLLNKTLKKYNTFLEQRFGFFINNKLGIVQKYITDQNVANRLNSELLNTFDISNQNKSMEYIFEKFPVEKTILQDNHIFDKFKNNTSILAIIISIIVGLTTISSLILSFYDNGASLP